MPTTVPRGGLWFKLIFMATKGYVVYHGRMKIRCRALAPLFLFVMSCFVVPGAAQADDLEQPVAQGGAAGSEADQVDADDGEADEKPGVIKRFKVWRLERIAATDAYLTLSPAAMYVNLRDTRMTPLIYSGFGFGGTIQDFEIHPRMLWITTVTGYLAAPTVPDVLPGFYQNIAGELDLDYLYRVPGIGRASGGELAAGGGISGGINVRSYDKLQNSALNFDIIVSINAGARWQHDFTILGRTISWFLYGSTPLFSYVGRYPEYTLHGIQSYWLPPWRFARATVESGLNTNLRWSEENRMQFSYRWEFTALDEIDGLHILRTGTHQVALSLAVRRM